MTVTEGTESRQGMHPRPVAGMATGHPTPPLPSGLRSRRRPALLALGVSLAVVGVLLDVALVNRAGDRQAVVAVRQPVAFGAVLTAEDLTTVELSRGQGLDVIPAGRLEQLIGRVAATNLTPGSLLVASEVTSAAPPGPGQVLVALAIPPSRLPAGSVQAGDRILVVDTPAPGADPPDLPPQTIPATVVRLGPTDANGVTVVDVTVASAAGPALAARSATGRIALILQPRTG
jgi:hypothetical protein